MAQSDFDHAVERYRQALHDYVAGDPGPVTEFFSRREDVTLANPLGPPRIRPAEVDQAIVEGAAYLRDGSVRGFEEVSRYSRGPTLAMSSSSSGLRRGYPAAKTWFRSRCGSP